VRSGRRKLGLSDAALISRSDLPWLLCPHWQNGNRRYAYKGMRNSKNAGQHLSLSRALRQHFDRRQQDGIRTRLVWSHCKLKDPGRPAPQIIPKPAPLCRDAHVHLIAHATITPSPYQDSLRRDGAGKRVGSWVRARAGSRLDSTGSVGLLSSVRFS